MTTFSKGTRTGLVIVAALGVTIIGGLIFRSHLPERNADDDSSGYLGKGIENRLSKGRAGEATSRSSAKAADGDGIPADLTLAQASSLFEDFKSKHPGNKERLKFAQDMMKKLCELGYTQEAWDLIEKDQGDVRNNQLGAFFANAKLSNSELLGKISQSSLADIHVNFSGFMSRFKPEQYEEIVNSPDFKKFLGGLGQLDSKSAAVFKNNISSGLGSAITISLYESPGQSQDLLRIAARLNSEGVLDTSRFMDLAARFGSGDPFGSWSLISSVDSGGQTTVGQQRNNVIRNMLEADAPKALSTVLDNGSPSRASDIKSAVESWVNLDSRGATDWFQQNRATLSPEDGDAIAFIFSSYVGDGAQQWAEQIRNPTLKAEAIKKIAEAETARAEAARKAQ